MEKNEVDAVIKDLDGQFVPEERSSWRFHATEVHTDEAYNSWRAGAFVEPQVSPIWFPHVQSEQVHASFIDNWILVSNKLRLRSTLPVVPTAVVRDPSIIPPQFQHLLPLESNELELDSADGRSIMRDLAYILSRLREVFTDRRAEVWLTSHNPSLNSRPIDAIVRRKITAVIEALEIEEGLGYS